MFWKNVLYLFLLIVFGSCGLFAQTTLENITYGGPESNIEVYNNHLYYSGKNGLVTYNLSDGSKTYYDSPYGFQGLIQVDACGRVWSLFRNQTNNIQLQCIENGQVSIYSSDKNEEGMYYLFMNMDEQQRIWIGTYTQGLLCFDTVSMQWSYYNSDNTQVPLTGISCIFQDKLDHSLWFGTWDNGLIHYQNNQWSVVRFVGDLELNFIVCLEQSSDGAIWAGSHYGLFKYHNNSLEKNDFLYKVEYIFMTPDDHLLVSSYENGMYIVNSSLWEYPTTIGSPTQVLYLNNQYYFNFYGTFYKSQYYYANPEDLQVISTGTFNYPGQHKQLLKNPVDQSIWLISEQCVAKLDVNNQWTYYTQDNTMLDLSRASSFGFYQNTLWGLISDTNGGRLVSFDGNIWQIHPYQTDLKYLNNMYFDASGRIWSANFDELTYYENNQIHHIPFSNPNDNCYSMDICFDQNQNVWFYSYFGLQYYNPASQTFTLVSAQDDIKAFYPIDADHYYLIYGNLLHEYENGVHHSYPLTGYSFIMQRDEQGVLWIVASDRVYKFENHELSQYEEDFYISYGYYRKDLILRNNNKYFFNYDNFYIFNEQGVNPTDPIVSPGLFSLKNYPNPFNPSTTILFSLDTPGTVELNIFNIKGQKVKSYGINAYSKGEHRVMWDGKDDDQKNVSSGIYFVRISSDSKQQIHKMMLIK